MNCSHGDGGSGGGGGTFMRWFSLAKHSMYMSQPLLVNS